MSRRAILFIDGSDKCERAKRFLQEAKIDFVEYNVKDQLESGCCGDGFTTEAPSIFAPEGIFRGMSGIRRYAKKIREKKHIESESAYW